MLCLFAHIVHACYFPEYVCVCACMRVCIYVCVCCRVYAQGLEESVAERLCDFVFDVSEVRIYLPHTHKHTQTNTHVPKGRRTHTDTHAHVPKDRRTHTDMRTRTHTDMRTRTHAHTPALLITSHSRCGHMTVADRPAAPAVQSACVYQW